MKQTITIQHLHCEGRIGIYPREREVTQPLVLHVALTFDATDVLRSGDVAHSVDYDALCRRLCARIASQHFDLLETLLAALLDDMAALERVEAVSLRIDKPKALEDFGAVVSLSGEWVRGQASPASSG